MSAWPRHDDAWYRRRLATPPACPRVVVDTDAANEIDDVFALAWALLRPGRLRIEAVYAAPYSFEYRRRGIVDARRVRDEGIGDPALLERYGAQLAHFERRGWDPAAVALPCFDPPGIGMERSVAAVDALYRVLGLDAAPPLLRGATGYLEATERPQRSAAAEHLVEAALATPADEPLYVAAIGCVTNVASALLLEPRIAERIVVVWTSGYPSHAPHPNPSFNLEQDLHAARVLLDSGVPLVYLPGFQVGAQLRLSLPEVERWVRDRGAIGAHLFDLYTHNPLRELYGLDDGAGQSWVIWDLIVFAWLMEPRWVPSTLVLTPRLGDDTRWQPAPGRPWMREAHAVQRDAIFRDFFAALASAS